MLMIWQALLRPSFRKDQISDLDALEVHVARLISLIPKDAGTVDLQSLFFRYTLDTSTEFLFGDSVCSLEDNNISRQNFVRSFEYAVGFMITRFRLGRILGRFYRNRSFDEACKVTRNFADVYVAKSLEHGKAAGAADAKESPDERYIFLNELARKTQDSTQLRTAALNVLLAGRDTTASLLSNTFFVLAQRPDIWDKLKIEVDQLQGERPTYQSLRDMKYLRFILNECTFSTNARLGISTNLIFHAQPCEYIL